jgi:hypothetical protein
LLLEDKFAKMSTETSTIELHRVGTPEAEIEEGTPPPEGRHEFQLPPADGGKDAWLFLAACFIIEALVWGMYPSLPSTSPTNNP